MLTSRTAWALSILTNQMVSDTLPTELPSYHHTLLTGWGKKTCHVVTTMEHNTLL